MSIKATSRYSACLSHHSRKLGLRYSQKAPWYDDFRISNVTSNAVAMSEIASVTGHPGLPMTIVDAATPTNAAAHASSDGRSIRTTLQNKKKCATTNPTATPTH